MYFDLPNLNLANRPLVRRRVLWNRHGFRDNYLLNANAIYLPTVEGCKVGGCGREGGGFEISGGKDHEGREGNAKYLALHRYRHNDPASQYDDQGLLQGYKAAE